VVRNLPYVILFVGLVLLLGLIVPFPVSAIIRIPQTGQDKCYGQTPIGWDEIPCSGNGQDGEQRSGVPWPDPRFSLTYFDSKRVHAQTSQQIATLSPQRT
jgi:hypothetical protein